MTRLLMTLDRLKIVATIIPIAGVIALEAVRFAVVGLVVRRRRRA